MDPNQPESVVSVNKLAPVIASQQAPITLDTNVLEKRVLAVIVDLIIWGIILFIATMFFGQKDTFQTVSSTTNSAGELVNSEVGYNFESNLTGVPALIYFVSFSLYFILMEVFTGGTIGKLMLGIKVVSSEGMRISLVQAIVRYLLKVVDMFPYIFPLVGIVLMAGSPTKQRLGDKIAKTLVVKNRLGS